MPFKADVLKKLKEKFNTRKYIQAYSKGDMDHWHQKGQLIAIYHYVVSQAYNIGKTSKEKLKDFIDSFVDIGLNPDEYKMLEEVSRNFRIRMPIDKNKYVLKHLEVHPKVIKIIIDPKPGENRDEVILAALEEFSKKINAENLEGRIPQLIGFTPQELEKIVPNLEAKAMSLQEAHEKELPPLATAIHEGVKMTFNPLAAEIGRARSTVLFDKNIPPDKKQQSSVGSPPPHKSPAQKGPP